ncbi:PIG-L family deacetylase [Aurantibacter crassamenti]|uniref:PIG-L family deacetylase n=1 Tax=Aurantibacter crassamenti TaxID=1837375 RepID=UPI00193976B8|nr:PIG-L family deacetylase [Aurantibacter crassamenti]MBM1106860.1 PIG-L family deacetylase [Aurantibacter crassamenti]
MRVFLVFFLGILLTNQNTKAQSPSKPSSSEIYHSIQKLNFLGSALYIAAHPDDENTRLISYLSNNEKARTGYLSLTRGDGGQNLIGSELRELLGVLRTQELLAARRTDGGEQFFSRANDFGYSKHPDETLKIWNKKDVLGDVVWAIRKFQPDVIINRFDHRSPGSTHGHHTSSAMLSVEAFDLTNNSEQYKEQLKHVETWQPKRLFFNTSWWFYGSEEKFEKADKSKMLSMDVGVFYPSLGLSNNEIASMASSQHLCQGFGRLNTRGSENEYVELLKGDMPLDKTNIFDGIDTSWLRVEGGKAIGEILTKVENNFDFKNPSVHLPQLVEAYNLLQDIKNEHWKDLKSEELKNIILEITGLFLEVSANNPIANPGSNAGLAVEVLNRSNAAITLKSLNIPYLNMTDNKNILLKENEKHNYELEIQIPSDAAYTSPYWLNEKGSLGMYKVDDQSLIGKPETPRTVQMEFVLDFNGQEISFIKPVIHRYAKRDKGEIYQPFEILPVATAAFNDKVLIFADGKPKTIPVTIKAHANNLKGEVQFCFSEGWKVDQETKPFTIEKKGDVQTINFILTPPENEDESFISPIIRIDDNVISKELVTIAYDHIPTQSVLLPSEAKVVRLNIEKVGEHIGYIVGAGDEVPQSLEQIGYTVHTVDVNSIGTGTLKKYDAVVVGIRAYNVLPDLKFKQKYLLDFVKEGGNLIIQYNTAGRWDKAYENIAPYKLKLSRDRVTDENSAVEIIAKNNALVNFPNKINQSDFDGWVQERGLYFPDEWGKEFTPILSMKDQGESAKKGSLLVAPYGKGNYIYTGLSFFRELPAGVSGAYKLFANMLSIGKEKVEKEPKVKG